MNPTRPNFLLVLVSLLVLRVVIGLHFYNEGVTKVRSGEFSCAGFLSQANGPSAGFFKGLLDDYDGRVRLCIAPIRPEPGVKDSIDTETTIAIWRDFVEQAGGEFQFDEQQLTQGRTILAESENYLDRWLVANQQDILAWVGQADRLNGFRRDGDRRSETFREVAGLNDHMDSIARQRSSSAGAWFREIETVWTELECRINDLHRPEMPADERLQLSRPWRSRPVPFVGSLRWSPQQLIDTILPWFDAVVGLLLIIGLFSRLAAVAGIALLLGVVATQPFWVPGSENTWNQWVEIAGLFVVFATAAGRFGGLDYFLWRPKVAAPETGD